MRYYYDCEFLEGTQKKRFGHTKPTIDLISIGIVAQDGREYYEISKDFNLKEAWNRYDVDEDWSTGIGQQFKKYWIRDNVLKPIFEDLRKRSLNDSDFCRKHFHTAGTGFTYDHMRALTKQFGKTNKEIAEDVIDFCAAKKSIFETDGMGQAARARLEDNPIELLGYYSAYDHVVLCWLFGKMINLPKGFPMYTRDLKQIWDERLEANLKYFANKGWDNSRFEQASEQMKLHPDYPKQENEHRAIDDARWNRKLHQFLTGASDSLISLERAGEKITK